MDRPFPTRPGPDRGPPSEGDLTGDEFRGRLSKLHQSFFYCFRSLFTWVHKREEYRRTLTGPDLHSRPGGSVREEWTTSEELFHVEYGLQSVQTHKEEVTVPLLYFVTVEGQSPEP